MIAENKQEFFEQLQRELQKLGVQDTGELMSDLEEHFAEGERRGVPENETCRELGSISEIARSCLDLKSEAINSMVARDVERKKGVSLTKPGRSVPADPSLAASAEAAENGDSQNVDVSEIAPDLPSYTPEHISGEIYPNAAQNTASQGGSGNIGSSGAGNIGQTETDTNAGADHGASQSNGESGTTSSSTNCSANGTTAANGGTFEKVGKAVDAACDKAGKALNDALNKAGTAVNGALNKAGAAVGAFRPSDSYRKNINNRRNGGDIPPQYTKVKAAGGSKFVDTTGLRPNVNAGRLLCELLLDVFLWIWLVPVIFSLVITVFAAAISLVGTGIMCLFKGAGFAQFKFVTRILFALGFLNLSAAVFCLACLLIKAPIALMKNIISRHIKAIYDI